MTRKYKTSYKTHRNSSRFAVIFDASTIAAQVQEVCTICGGKIEECPMMRGVCYSCYSSLVTSPETFTALKEQTELAAEQHKAMQIILDVASASTPEPVATERKSFAEYMATDYVTEKQTRAAGWKEWKEAHPNSSPYHF